MTKIEALTWMIQAMEEALKAGVLVGRTRVRIQDTRFFLQKELMKAQVQIGGKHVCQPSDSK